MGDLDVERHDGPEQAVCVGQWCCDCAVHPIGKPWGWNHEAWERHIADHHPERAASDRRVPLEIAVHGHGVTRERVEQVGQAFGDLLVDVARAQGAPLSDDFRLRVGYVLFRCDRCGHRQLFEASRAGWHHHAGDDICPACLLGDWS